MVIFASSARPFARARGDDRHRPGRRVPAQKSWRRLDGHGQLPKLILGVKFADGMEVAAKSIRQPASAAA